MARIWRELVVLRAAFYKGCVLSLGKYISQRTTACRWSVSLTQACLTLGEPMDYSPPDFCLQNSPGKNIAVGSHSLLQGSSRPRDQTRVSFIAGRFFTIWATRARVKSALTSPSSYFLTSYWRLSWKNSRKARKHGCWLVLSTRVGIYGPREECTMCRNECKGENKEYPIPMIKALFQKGNALTLNMEHCFPGGSVNKAFSCNAGDSVAYWIWWMS